MASINTQAGGAKFSSGEAWNIILMVLALAVGGFIIIWATKQSVKNDIKGGAEAVKEIIYKPVEVVKTKYTETTNKQAQTYNDKYSSNYAARYQNTNEINKSLITLGDKITFGKASELGKAAGDFLRSKGWY